MFVNEGQEACVNVCRLKLGDGHTPGHYVDLEGGQGTGYWWFYAGYEDGDFDCYPVNADDMRDVIYPILAI